MLICPVASQRLEPGFAVWEIAAQHKVKTIVLLHIYFVKNDF